MAARIIRSTMAGTIARLEVASGAAVAKEQPLLYLEVMKMEIAVEAPAAGRVATVHVAAGDLVDEGQVLFTLEV
jgi:acetyl-CoA carboxylase biotin carboxyl carrier protein